MRRRILISLLAALALTSCVYERYKPEYCAEGDVYLSFVLKGAGGTYSDNGTKANTTQTSLSAQTVAEQLVSRVDLYFYSDAGEYLGKWTQTLFTQQSGSDGDNVSNQVGQFTVKLDYKPSHMLVTVNSSEAFDKLRGLSLSAAREKLQASANFNNRNGVSVKYKDNSGTSQTAFDVKPFYMSSSVYLDGTNAEVCDVRIPEGKIKDNKFDASSVPIEVYLERLAAKVTLKLPKLDYMVPVATSQDSLTAKVTLEGWNVNAVNRDSYYFKKVNTAWTYTWQGIQWNNAAKYRSYWAQDFNYEAGEQPGAAELEQQTSPLPTDKFLYRKLADVNLPLKKVTDSSHPDYGKYIGTSYCLENTAGADILPVTDTDVSSLYSRATHVLIKARLSFAAGSGATEDDDNFASATNFFRYKGIFYTRTGLLRELRKEFPAVLPPSIPDSDLELVSAKDLSYCKGYDKGERVALRQNSTNTYPELKEAGENIRIDGFKDGYFYYKIPIEHISDEALSPSASFYPVARYGVVRNHNYEISVGSELGGIGTGVWETGFDIRPFRKADERRVAAHVRISPWTQFENRFVFVDPSGMLITDGQVVDEYGNDLNGDGWYF